MEDKKEKEEQQNESEIIKVLQEQREADKKKYEAEIEALKEESKRKEKEYANQVRMILSGKSTNNEQPKEDDAEKSYYETVLENTRKNFRLKGD